MWQCIEKDNNNKPCSKKFSREVISGNLLAIIQQLLGNVSIKSIVKEWLISGENVQEKLYIEFSPREVNACAREDELERRLLRLFGGLSQIVSDRNSIFIVIEQATLVFLLNFTSNFDQLQEKLPIEQSSGFQ